MLEKIKLKCEKLYMVLFLIMSVFIKITLHSICLDYLRNSMAFLGSKRLLDLKEKPYRP